MLRLDPRQVKEKKEYYLEIKRSKEKIDHISKSFLDCMIVLNSYSSLVGIVFGLVPKNHKYILRKSYFVGDELSLFPITSQNNRFSKLCKK